MGHIISVQSPSNLRTELNRSSGTAFQSAHAAETIWTFEAENGRRAYTTRADTREAASGGGRCTVYVYSGLGRTLPRSRKRGPGRSNVLTQRGGRGVACRDHTLSSGDSAAAAAGTFTWARALSIAATQVGALSIAAAAPGTSAATCGGEGNLKKRTGSSTVGRCVDASAGAMIPGLAA